jgi:hypothetical protein
LNNEQVKKPCTKCEKPKRKNVDFYASLSDLHKDGRYPVCKQCLNNNLDVNNMQQVKDTLLQMNKPFLYYCWASSQEEVSKTGKDLFGIYLKNLSLNYKSLTWKDSEFGESESINSHTELKQESPEVIEDKNKEDVLRMLGYDPFETENPLDKRHLYNKLVDFLDESTLEDSFKLPAVIEIVKSYNQLDKINRAISEITSNVKAISSQTGSVKALIDSKQKMLKAVLDLAKDNGISVNHNNNKSKGAGTLTGIIKSLQEKGFEEAQVNLFDVETAHGIKQVADISNESIKNQLQFDENDYTSMIIDQRELIQELESKVLLLEEENRKFKKSILKSGADKGGDIND